MTDSATEPEGADRFIEAGRVSSVEIPNSVPPHANRDNADIDSGVPAEASESSVTRRVRPGWDVPIAIVGLVLLAAATAVGATLGTFLGWAGVSCGTDGGCNSGLIMAGMFLATLGVIITAIVFLVITIARITVRRMAWWAPLAGIGAIVLLFVLGLVLASIGSVSGTVI